MKYYYELHCFFGGNNGYSIFVEVDKQMNVDELVQWCRDNKKFEEEGDEDYVDYTEEITELEYNEWK